MTDIATLGLAVDSRQVTTATKALNDLTAAAKPATKAADDLTKAVKPAASATTGMATATSTAAAAATALGTAQATSAKGTTAAATATTVLNKVTTPAATAVTGMAAATMAATSNVVSLSAAANKAATGGVKTLTTQTGLAGHELVNLQRQASDIFVSLQGGQSPFTVLTQQGAQVLDIFTSTKGTVSGFFSQMLSGVASVLSPARLLVGSVAAIGLTFASAGVSWSGAQRDIQIGLMGIGRASQATVGDINKIADATSTWNGLSTSQAREVATTLASTGKIGVENIERLTGQAKNFAAVLGLDVPKAAELMATIFANPTDGAKQLAARIGGIDSVTMKYVETLDQQGDRQAAIKALIEATIPGIAGAAEKTGMLTKGWNAATNAASNAYTAMGKAISGTPDQQAQSQLEERRMELEKLISTTESSTKATKNWNSAFVNSTVDSSAVSPLEAYRKELDSVNEALAKTAAAKKVALGVDAAQTTLQVAPIVTALAPAPELIRNVNANLEAMKRVMSDPAFEEFRAKMGEQLPQALSRLSNQAAALQLNPRLADPISSQIDNLKLQTKLLTDQSPANRARVESQLAYNDAVKQGASAEEAASIARARGALAGGGPMANIQNEMQKIALYGQTANASDVARTADLNRQAAAIQGITIDDTRAATIKRLAVEQSLGVTQIKASTDALTTETATIGMSAGAAAQYSAIQNAINDAKRAGRTLTEENIAQITREAGALGAAAQQADTMRWAYSGLVQGPLQALTSAVASGSSAFDALKKAGLSALSSLASKLADMAAQNLWKAAFGGSGGGGGLLSSLFGIGGGSGGATPLPGSADFIGPTINHSGYGPGDVAGPTRMVPSGVFDNAPRFHSGIGPGERAAIIRNDESVLTPGQMKAMGGAGGASVTVNQTNTFNNADPGSEARMRQALEKTKNDAVREAVQQVQQIQGTTPSFSRGPR